MAGKGRTDGKRKSRGLSGYSTDVSPRSETADRSMRVDLDDVGSARLRLLAWRRACIKRSKEYGVQYTYGVSVGLNDEFEVLSIYP